MIDTAKSQLEKLSIHYIDDEKQFTASEHPVEPASAHLKELLTSYFLRSFNDLQSWTFAHKTDLKFNEVYSFARGMFSDPSFFHEGSVNILKQLVKSSQHHAIKPGEFFVALVSSVQLNDKTARALVLVKSEVKTEFLQVRKIKNAFEMDSQQGLDLKKIDKGCLILDTAGGLDVFILDHSNKGSEARYWTDLFLGIELQENDQFKTGNYLSLTKEFITRDMETSIQIDKADQADLLNRSVNYFRKNGHFREEEFIDEVFSDQNVVKSFKSFKQSYQEDQQIDIGDEFSISADVVKKQARIFKSVIKLDKNFHLYIHGNRDLIEQGYDERKRKKFYKIYFDEEK